MTQNDLFNKRGDIKRRKGPPRTKKRNLDERIDRAKKLGDEGKFLKSALLLLRLMRSGLAPPDRAEEIMDLFIPVYEKYLKEKGTVRCPECRGWAKKENAIARCPACGAEFPFPE